MNKYIFTVRFNPPKELSIDSWLKVSLPDGVEAMKVADRLSQAHNKVSIGEKINALISSIQLRMRFNNDIYQHICMVRVPAGTELGIDEFTHLLQMKESEGTLFDFLEESHLF